MCHDKQATMTATFGVPTPRSHLQLVLDCGTAKQHQVALHQLRNRRDLGIAILQAGLGLDELLLPPDEREVWNRSEIIISLPLAQNKGRAESRLQITATADMGSSAWVCEPSATCSEQKRCPCCSAAPMPTRCVPAAFPSLLLVKVRVQHRACETQRAQPRAAVLLHVRSGDGLEAQVLWVGVVQALIDDGVSTLRR